MTLLQLSLVFGLLFDGGKGQERFQFSRPDQDVTLPCGQLYNYGCSEIEWLSNTLSPTTRTEAKKGGVNPRSPRSGRLNLTSDCSLVIGRVTDKDVGYYTCRLIDDNHSYVRVYLSLLRIFPIPPDHDPKKDDEVKLECILLRDRHPSPCERNRLRWVNETGAVVTEGVSQSNRGADCLSYLVVTRQSRNKKKFTCQVVNKQNTVEIKADYTPFIEDNGGSVGDKGGPGSGSGSGPDLTFIIVGVLVVLLLLVIAAVVLIKYKRRAKGTEDIQAPIQQTDESESTLTYVTVKHDKQAPPKKKAATEEEVTYSTVKSAMRTEDISPISLYCSVSKPK